MNNFVSAVDIITYVIIYKLRVPDEYVAQSEVDTLIIYIYYYYY